MRNMEIIIRDQGVSKRHAMHATHKTEKSC